MTTLTNDDVRKLSLIKKVDANGNVVLVACPSDFKVGTNSNSSNLTVMGGVNIKAGPVKMTGPLDVTGSIRGSQGMHVFAHGGSTALELPATGFLLVPGDKTPTTTETNLGTMLLLSGASISQTYSWAGGAPNSSNVMYITTMTGSTTANAKTGITFEQRGLSTRLRYAGIELFGASSGNSSSILSFWTRGTKDSSLIIAENMRIDEHGRLGFGMTHFVQTGVPTQMQQAANFYCKDSYTGYNGLFYSGSQASSTDARNTLLASKGDYDLLGPSASSGVLYWYMGMANGTTYRHKPTMYAFTFTGQHLSVPLDSALSSSLANFTGMIVRSSGQYQRFDKELKEWVTDARSITINETLPRVSICDTRNDRAAYGVISNRPNDYIIDTDTGLYENDQDGQAYLWNDLRHGEIRINSIGEGAIWVCNINGDLENGDFITSCEVPGYGMRQDDDLLHNYTVAKVTMDCTFDTSSDQYYCEEFVHDDTTYRKAFVGCTYHCG